MAYVVPTPEQFLTRFPVFGSKEPAQVAAVLAEASNYVDATWREADYVPAIMYLTAHMLATDDSEVDAEISGSASAATGEIASESFGGMSVSYRGPEAGASGGNAFTSQYDGTSYGRRFLALARMNFPPIVAI